MSTLQDTELLDATGPMGLRHVQAGACEVPAVGGTATRAGRDALTARDNNLHARVCGARAAVPACRRAPCSWTCRR
ncbi:hypothetical protein ACFV0T_06875 [Streptomyces sp. NPDC059582]|uniref:hypothetical protein n=1 Tax=Streptomyces sp. NPDC059582 TaxID=3346875 RepID=UPI00368DA4D3